MKNALKLFWIIAIVAIIGFSMAACKDETGELFTVTITGLNPNTVYEIGIRSEDRINGWSVDPSTSNAAGTVTSSFNSIHDSNGWWGKTLYITYQMRISGPPVGPLMYSRNTHTVKTGSLSLHAGDFEAE